MVNGICTKIFCIPLAPTTPPPPPPPHPTVTVPNTLLFICLVPYSLPYISFWFAVTQSGKCYTLNFISSFYIKFALILIDYYNCK